jgi:site-specific DNA-methyltransferase (adenine-specific)
MALSSKITLMIDPGFQALLPSLSPEEISTLEASLLRDGCLQPILTWKNRIIDGHNRYALCQKHRIPFHIKEMVFPDRKAVLAWMLEFQLGRRNVNLYQKCVLALKFKRYYAEKAKSHLGRPSKSCPRRRQVFQPINTLTKLAQITGTSRSVVGQVEYILRHAPAEVKAKAWDGTYSIRKACLRTQDLRRNEQRALEMGQAEKFKNPSLYNKEWRNGIFCGDVLNVLKKVTDGLATCVISSPPYNRGNDYGQGSEVDNRPYKKEYLPWLGAVITEAARVLRTGGRLILNIDSVTNRQDPNYGTEHKRPIYADLVTLVRELDVGLLFRDEICWYKHSCMGRKSAYGSYCSPTNPHIRRNHEYVLIWSKGQWDLPNISGQKSDLTPEEFNDWTFSVWPIHPITRRATHHPCAFSPELIQRLIKLYSYPGDLILDPFVGTGTTAVVAASLNRSYLGIDRNPSYCSLARKQLKPR